MENNGYNATRQKTDTIVAALHDVATLVGTVGTAEVKLETGGEIVPGLGLSGDAADLSRRARDIQQGIFKVLVLGEFKNGKSTLLNSMLGSKVLPAKVTPATAIITVLVHGESKQVQVYESGQAAPRIFSWEDFSSEFKLTKNDVETLDKTGFLDRFQAIDYAQIESTHPFFANGVRLIDSPGLGEQASRTRVTTNFLKQSHAVIFVLNATRILSQEEKQFIESRLGQARLNQVFFVVNRVNQIEPGDLDDVKNWVQTVLKHHFVDESGQFDAAFYARRVFFLNAQGALEARLAQPLDEAALEASGVPALETQLEQFLTGEEKLGAVLETTVQALTGVVSEARRRIVQQKKTLGQPVDELERRRDEAQQKLKSLEEKKNDIERTIFLFRDAIKQRIYSNLRDHLQEMHARWPQDGQNYINFDEVMSLLDVVQSFVSKEAEKRIAAALEVQVKKYLRAKLAEWSEAMPAAIMPDVERMMTEVQAQVEDFQLGLDEIGQLFAGDPATDPADGDPHRANRLVGMIMGFGDMGSMAGADLDAGDWTGLFSRLLQQILMVVVIFGLFGGPLAWILLAVIESWYILLQRDKFKQRILEKIGDRLHEELLKELPTRQTEIYALVEKRFSQFAAHVTQTLQNQIDEKRGEIDRILRQKQDATFSVEREKNRLDNVGLKLLELFDQVSLTAYGKTLTPAELDRLAEGKSLLADPV